MGAKPQPLDVSDLPDLLRIAEEVHDSRQPRVLRRRGENLAVLIPIPATAERTPAASASPEQESLDAPDDPSEYDPWADYDPDRVRAALHRARGSLAGLDVETFLAELREAREQDSSGRPR
jgi:hypothetical protein